MTPRTSRERSTSSSSAEDSSTLLANPPSDGSTDSSAKPKVSFGEIRVRQYSRIVGDHPGVREGPPIGIGWEFLEQEAKSVEEYEGEKPETRRDFALSATQRKMLLTRDLQVPHDEIRKAENEVRRIKYQREDSMAQGKVSEAMQTFVQSAKRKIARRFNRDSVVTPPLR